MKKSVATLMLIAVNVLICNAKDNVVFRDDFSNGLKNWWVEGGQSVEAKDGKLYIKADPLAFKKGKNGGVCTVWCRQKISGNIRIDFDIKVISSAVKTNNINLFLFYSDPSGKRLEDSVASRPFAAYQMYHNLNGYIFTYLNDTWKKSSPPTESTTNKARFRIRRCPGFKLLNQTYAYHIVSGRSYHVSISRIGEKLSISVDGKEYLTATDKTPLTSGYWGFRTYRTYLMVSNPVVTSIN